MNTLGVGGSQRTATLESVIRRLVDRRADAPDVLRLLREQEPGAYTMAEGIAGLAGVPSPGTDADKKEERKFLYQLAYFLAIIKEGGVVEYAKDAYNKRIRGAIRATRVAFEESYQYDGTMRRLRLENIPSPRVGVITQYLVQAETKEEERHTREDDEKTRKAAEKKQPRPTPSATSEPPHPLADASTNTTAPLTKIVTYLLNGKNTAPELHTLAHEEPATFQLAERIARVGGLTTLPENGAHHRPFRYQLSFAFRVLQADGEVETIVEKLLPHQQRLLKPVITRLRAAPEYHDGRLALDELAQRVSVDDDGILHRYITHFMPRENQPVTARRAYRDEDEEEHHRDVDAAANERKFQDGLTDAVTESIKKKREFPPEDRACQFFVNDAARRAEQQLPEEQREYATRIALAMADDDEIDHPAHDLKLLRVQVNEIARKMGFANYNAGRRAAKERHAQVLLEDQVCASFADKAARRAEKILPEEQLPYVTLIARSMFDGDSLNEAMKYTKLPQARIEHIVKTMGFTHYEAGRRAAKERLATAQASPRP